MKRELSPAVIMTALVIISAVIGVAIPSFYDWTGADQSRPTPSLFWVPVSLMGLGVAFCVSLRWLKLRDTSKSNRWRTALPFLALVACMYLPFLWVGGKHWIQGVGPSDLAALLLGMPSLVANALVCGAFGMRVNDSMPLAIVLTLLEYLCGPG